VNDSKRCLLERSRDVYSGAAGQAEDGPDSKTLPTKIGQVEIAEFSRDLAWRPSKTPTIAFCT
jgi:hypothetical protein